MTDNEILRTLTALFREVFSDPTISLTLETSSDDIADWDSMSQITLAVEIEHHFRIKLKAAEMEDMRSVGHLVALIKARLPVTTP
jgi:acyl carrier protein